MPFAAALSEHPVPAHAVGEVAGEILDRFGQRPDLTMVFVTPPFAGALEDVVAAIDDILHPLVLLGCAAESIVGPHREVERTAAVSLFAARTGPLLPVALGVTDGGSGRGPGADLTVTGWPDDIAFAPRALLLVADPFSSPVEPFL